LPTAALDDVLSRSVGKSERHVLEALRGKIQNLMRTQQKPSHNPAETQTEPKENREKESCFTPPHDKLNSKTLSSLGNAVEINGEPWMVGKDVAAALGYAKPENAIATHIDDEDKTTTLIQGTGSNYKSKAVLINESGMYSLVLSSKLPSAKEFKRLETI